MVLMVIFVCLILAGILSGAYLQARALGSQNIRADMHKTAHKIVQKVAARFSPAHSVAAQTSTQAANHNPIQADALNRLIRYPNKQEVPCPPQTARTMVLLVSGQSNSANHAGQRHTSQHGDKVLNYFDGKCYIAQSPLLGSTGLEGESWTLLGNQLIAQGKADRVIIVSTGVAGSSIKQWQIGSDFQKTLVNDYDNLATHYRPTHFLWHQGETDFVNQTTQSEYEQMLAGLLNSLRERGMNAPMYISHTSQCWMNPNWKEDNPIRRAQSTVINTVANTHAGVDSDALMGELDRFDNCHFSETGQEKFARAWLGILSKETLPAKFD